MLRRSVFLAILTLLAAEPAFAQNWMSRFLRERKNHKAEAKRDAATPPPGQAAEAPQTPETPQTPPAASETDAAAAAPTEPEVRRALPVDGPDSAPVEPPTPPAVPFDSPPAIPRAEPVSTPLPTPAPTPEPTPVPAPPSRPVQRPTPAEAKPAPTAAIPAPTATPPAPTAAVPTPAPTPVPDAPVLTPAPSPAQAEATPLPTPDALDPNSNVIRLSPGAAPLPADLNQFNYAGAFYAKKQYDRAAPEYERYLSLYPNGADREAALFRLAESYRQIGNLNAARQNYETVVFSFQNGDFVGPAAYRLADLCFQDKSYSDAVTFYRKASVRVKDPAIALSAKFYAARSLENLKFTREAVTAYQDVLSTKENNPFREASQLALSSLLTDNGRKTEAVLTLRALLEETQKPSVKAEATVRIGLLLLDQNLNAKAIAELNKALKMPELGRWREVAEVALLRVLYNDGKFKQVLETYKTSGQEFSAEVLPEVLLIVANSNRQLGKYAPARALYEQAIRDYPSTVYAREASYERLIALYNANAPELIAEVDAYLAQNPEANSKHDQLTLLKAESLYKTKNYAGAAPLYASLDSSGLPSSLKAEALFKHGWCDAQTGNHADAIQAFSAFLSRYPAHKLAPVALAQRASNYERAKNYKAAVSDFTELLNRYPKAKEREFALLHKALILGQQDENKAMVETFNLLLAEFPKSHAAGQANYWIGVTAFQANHYKEALPPLVAARRLDKEFAEKATALIFAADFNLEDREALAQEVDKAGPKVKIPSAILRWLGGEYLKANDAARAEKYLTLLTTRTQSEELSPNDWLNLGQARTRLGKWDEAETALRTNLKLAVDPIPQATGYLALGQAQLGAGKFDEAQGSSDQVLSLQPEGRLNAQGRMLSGSIAMARKDYDGAAKLFQSVAVVYEDPVITPQALEEAWQAYKKSGNDTQAAKVLNELQTRFPEYKLSTPPAERRP